MNLLAVATSDYIGLMLLIAMLISSKIRRADAGHIEYKLFTAITILTMIACVVDFLSFFSDGKSGFLMRAINTVANTYCFMANPIFIAAWCIYEDLKLYHSKTRIKKIYTYAFIPAVLLVLIAIVNNFVPIIYTIDSNNVYKRLPFSYFYYVIDFGYVIFSIYILKKFEERYGKVRFFPLYLMIGPIFLGCMLQSIFYGISLIWVSMSVGLTAIYMSLQNEFSYLDRLTGLYNRAYLDYQLEMISKEKKTVGGIMIDVDYFKSINDTFGHHVGDEALIDVARVIIFAKPDKAIATRFAGDEFIILVPETSEKEMKNILKSLHDEIDLFNETEGRQYKLSLSIGYSIFNQNTETLDDFLKHMDDNMYEEKQINHISELSR
ncbi:MAG: GGDEF domain-containing protein [Butyrivibrio sp.]|nr:GGDEF domain-containing protein [Butyrivibrio sp.]MBR1641193.1 GGDEF domain-containing protein [Butyrivibrio sp.]